MLHLLLDVSFWDWEKIFRLQMKTSVKAEFAEAAEKHIFTRRKFGFDGSDVLSSLRVKSFSPEQRFIFNFLVVQFFKVRIE